MRLKPGHMVAFLLLALFIVSILSSGSWPTASRIFVLSCAGPGIILLAISITKGLFRPTEEGKVTGISRGEVVFFCWIFGFLAGIWFIGFQLSAILFIFSYVKFQGRRSFKLSLLLAFSVFIVVTGIFTKLLHVPWPESLVKTWLIS